MERDRTVTILQKLHTDRQAAGKFVHDPASEWQSLGGQLPAGVTPAQFSQRIRAGANFKAIQAVANGQPSVSLGWSPCVTGVMFLFDTLGIASVGAAIALAPAVAAFFAADVTVISGLMTGATGAAAQTTLYGLAIILCRGA